MYPQAVIGPDGYVTFEIGLYEKTLCRAGGGLKTHAENERSGAQIQDKCIFRGSENNGHLNWAKKRP